MSVAERELAETTSSRTVSIVLIDDHAVVRAGLRVLLEVAFGHTVFEAGSATEGVQLVHRERPDVVLVDARMPEHDGIWATQQIQAAHPEIPVIVLSTYDTEDYVNGALDAGAVGYLLKEASADQLRDAIDIALHRRGLYLYPSIAAKTMSRNRARSARDDGSPTPRETEILGLLAHGAKNHEIATTLSLSEKTVKTHISSIFRKLSVANRTEAVSVALSAGLVAFPQ